jgi:hypothetical protein
MLFSMYASFRWARAEHYAQKIAFVVLIFSSLSTVLSLPLSVAFSGPLPLVSFPFYEVWAERRLNLPPPLKYSFEVGCFDVCFVTVPVVLFVPQGPVRALDQDEGIVDEVSFRVVLFNEEIGAIPSWFLGILFFLFFSAVNALGALLGFLLSKIRVTQKTRLGAMAFLGSVALGIMVAAYGLWLYSEGIAPLTGFWSEYYHVYYSYSPYYYFGAVACVIFGITWSVVMLLDKARVFHRIYNAFLRPTPY